MHLPLLILAFIGAAAVLMRAGVALFRLAHGGAEALLAGDLARGRAGRGDITGLQDAAAARTHALRRRRYAVGALTLWIGLLLLPLLTPWPSAMYAAYSLLWFMPHRRSSRA